MRDAPTLRPLRDPIFVVGSVRSGTTLVAKCLGNHPGVLWAQSAGGGLELADAWCELAEIDLGMPIVRRTPCPTLSASDATEARRTRVRDGFAKLLAQQGNECQRFLNKIPHFWNKLAFVSAIFPDARLVVTGRDLRSTVLSTQVLWIRAHAQWGVRHYLPIDPAACWSCLPSGTGGDEDAARTFPGGAVRVLAEYWLRVYEAIGRDVKRFPTVMAVRHRDLVADPAGQLDRLCTALDLPPAPTPLATEIDPTRNDRWPKLLTRRERHELEDFIAQHRPRIERLRYADTTL